MSQIQVTMESETLARLDTIAASRSLSRDAAISEAIYNLWLQAQVEQGIKDIEEGRYFTNEEVKAESAQLLARLASQTNK